MLVVNRRLRVPLREFHFSFSRSSGKGGQNVNKVNSKATLRWAVGASRSLPEYVRARFMARYHRRVTKEGELVLSSQRFRDQGRNVADCLEKLREMLASVALPVARRVPTRPGRAAKERRLTAKRKTGRRKSERRRPRADDD